MNRINKFNPWALAEGVPLPITGDLRPLNKKYRRILYNATAIAAILHLVAIATWMVIRNMESKSEAGPRDVRIVEFEMGVPPSISQQESAPQLAVTAPVAPPSIGVPEPVPDFQATETTIATTEQLSEALVPTDLSSLGGSGDSLVVDLGDGDGNPSPTDFVAVEEQPVLINLPAPVYPELARKAGVEGTVTVRALVGKDGKVQDAFVTAGNDMLNESALDAVNKATFRPALQQHKPVAVWVQIPMNFSLN